MKNKVALYLEQKKNALSPTTIKSTTSVLRKYASIIGQGRPSEFYAQLIKEGKGDYTIQTYFVLAGSFYEFLNPTSENVFRVYRRNNRNDFKNAYQTKTIEKSYEEVRGRLEAQPSSPEKDACLYLLKTAQRSSEAGLSRTTSSPQPSEVKGGASPTITGKGGKTRLNLGKDINTSGSVSWNYYRVHKYLHVTCGITPHDLRKLALTRAASNGAGAADLCEIAGWSSIATAIRYLQPKRASELLRYLD